MLQRATRLPGVRSLWLRFPFGSVPTRVRHDIWSRPHYAYGIYSAADLAKRLGLSAISVIEFGVAGGRGLLAMENIAREISSNFTKIEILVLGFDGGQGLTCQCLKTIEICLMFGVPDFTRWTRMHCEDDYLLPNWF